jgi:phage repressor protein C with HTH and peptisase S24 domain
MPHKKGHTWKDLRGQAGSAIKKTGLKIKKAWQSDKNPAQEFKNKQANIANSNPNKKSTAGGRIQKKLVKSGFSKTELRHTEERHTAWKKAKKEGKLKEWEKKYHPDRIKSGQSRYGNK